MLLLAGEALLLLVLMFSWNGGPERPSQAGLQLEGPLLCTAMPLKSIRIDKMGVVSLLVWLSGSSRGTVSGGLSTYKLVS
jgi:hypothetical protein